MKASDILQTDALFPVSAVCFCGLIYLTISQEAFPPLERRLGKYSTAESVIFFTNVEKLYQVIYASLPHHRGIESC